MKTIFWLKFNRVLIGIVLWILHYILLIAILLQLSSVQTFLTKTAINYFAETYDLNIQIKSIYIKYPTKIAFGDVLIADNNGDTLIYANEIFTRISSFKFFDNKLYIDRVYLNDAFVNIYVDSLGVNNMDFLIEKFTSDTTPKDSSGKGFDIFCNEFEFEESRFKYKDYRVEPTEQAFNTSDIDISNLNVWISDFQMYGDTIELDLNDFNFYDKSGLNIEEISAHIIYSPIGLLLNDFVFRTDNSILLSRKFELVGSDSDWTQDPFKKAKTDISIDSCVIAFSDIALFNPDMFAGNEKFKFSGKIKGKLSDIKLRDIIFSYGNYTNLYADINFNNLPNIDNTFLFADIKTLTTSTKEIEKLMKHFSNDLNASLAKNIHSFGNISYIGNITGMLSDIVSFGTLETEAGIFKTDIALSVDSSYSKLNVDGKIEMQDILLGKIIGDEKNFGNVSLKSSLKGYVTTDEKFDLNLNTDIYYLGLLGYTYNDIKIIGDFSNTLYMGEVSVNDKNLKLNINGSYNTTMNTPIALLNISLDANLGKIMVDTSLNASLKTNLIADFRGEITESIIGKLTINDTEIKYNNKNIEMNHLKLTAKETNDSQQLTINSDFLDLNIEGSYNFIEIGAYFSTFLGKYLPSLFGEYLKDENFIPINDFSYTIDLKSLNELSYVFLPNLKFSNNIKINGIVDSKNDIFTLETELPNIMYDSISFSQTKIDLEAGNKEMKFSMGLQSINSDKLNILNNLDLYATIERDSVFLGMRWDDRKEIDYSGNFSLSAVLKNEKEDASMPVIYATIFESEVNIDNRNWKISETPITIDGNEIEIEDLLITYDNQSMRIAGFISENREKLLRLYITNTRLDNINPLIEDLGYKLDGNLTASGRFSGIYGEPLFKLSANIDQLQINKENFGRFDFTTDWLNDQLGLRIMGSNPFLKFSGNYHPTKDTLNLTVDIDNFKIDILEPFLNTVDVSNASGMIDGSIFISGKTTDPQINGFLDFERAKLTYDYLKLTVNLDDTVWITPNSILFNKFTVRDIENNVGIINGGVYHKKFDDFTFSFDINAKKLKMMNTTEVDNSLFYGTAYGTGNVKIQGNLSEFGIDVMVKTEQGTTFVLPMTDSYEAGENTILSFISKVNDDDDVTKLSEKKSNMAYYLNMDIELTPDAEAQIVFDPKVGDMIKANCKGNLNIYYDSNDDFKMIGEVEIVKGSYLFTLENIINKRFDVEQGGTIVWNGDPYDAIMNLNAVYRLRAPLWDLMMTIDSSSTYKKLTNIECHINMSGSLMTPEIKFDIRIPNADEKVLSQINNMSVDEKNKQMLYLLIMNRFFTPENMRTDYAQQRSAGGNVAGNTASELLSNQLSNWLSQISKDFDIGVKYRPGDEISSQELEVALSTQLLNDRILINGNLGVGQHESRTSNIVGDVEVQVKINKKGNLRVKGFTRANNEMNMEYGPYTNGMGIFFTDDFNTLGELFNKIFKWFIPKKNSKNTKYPSNVNS